MSHSTHAKHAPATVEKAWMHSRAHKSAAARPAGAMTPSRCKPYTDELRIHENMSTYEVIDGYWRINR